MAASEVDRLRAGLEQHAEVVKIKVLWARVKGRDVNRAFAFRHSFVRR